MSTPAATRRQLNLHLKKLQTCRQNKCKHINWTESHIADNKLSVFLYPFGSITVICKYSIFSVIHQHPADQAIYVGPLIQQIHLPAN